MAVTTDALRELHRIHRQLTDLRERLARGPKRIRARNANVASLEAAHQDAKQHVKTARMTVDRKQLDLKSGEMKILDLQTKLNTCKSNKEYQALQDQIAAANMANSVLSDEILEGYEEIDVLEGKIGEAQQHLETARAELAKTEAEVAAAAGNLESEVARLEAELRTAEVDLPPEFKTEYDRVVKAKGEDALAAVEGEHCGGCFQTLTPNQQNELHMSRAIFCRACGRLLYLPEK